MIPVHVNVPGGEEPADPVYYLVASNGTWLVSKSVIFTAVTPVQRAVAGLAPQSPRLTLATPKIPRQVMERIFGFFRTIFLRYEGEAVTTLFYAPATASFRIGIPPQRIFCHRVSGRWRTERRVAYGYVPRMEGFVKLGDAHSHADLPAFFSCADDRDDSEDGLRIVLGRLHHRHPDVSVSFVTNGVRFVLRAEEVLEDFAVPLTPPRAWIDRVSCEVEAPSGPGGDDALARS